MSCSKESNPLAKVSRYFGVLAPLLIVATIFFTQSPAKTAPEPLGEPRPTSQPHFKPVLEDSQLPKDLSISAKAGYKAARECPEICAKLFCYCGCDNTDAHSSLLDCFTSDHGVDCAICQKEAMVGLKMKKEKKSLAEIQKAVDQEFRVEYPWDEKSDAYKKYLSGREYKDRAADHLDKSGSQGSASLAKDKSTGTNGDAKQTSGKGLPTLRKGMTAGSCCGAKPKSK